jgi:hypothetical protein
MFGNPLVAGFDSADVGGGVARVTTCTHLLGAPRPPELVDSTPNGFDGKYGAPYWASARRPRRILKRHD